MKWDWLIKRNECDQLACKLLFIIGGIKEIENWYRFLASIVCYHPKHNDQK